MTEPTSTAVAVLRQAADLLQRRAKAAHEAAPDLWRVEPRAIGVSGCRCLGCYEVDETASQVWPLEDVKGEDVFWPPPVAEYLAAMQPCVALAFADWLDHTADQAERSYRAWAASVYVGERLGGADAHLERMYAAPLAVARAYLRPGEGGQGGAPAETDDGLVPVVTRYTISGVPEDHDLAHRFTVHLEPRPGDRWIVAGPESSPRTFLDAHGRWSFGSDCTDEWRAAHWHTFDTAVALAQATVRSATFRGQTAADVTTAGENAT